MNVSVGIYKEKKEKNFRMVILPSGRNKIGLGQYKDYGIISYLNKKDSKKIGEFVYWSLNESDDKVIEHSSNTKIEKQFYNCNSYRKVTNDYNMIFFELIEEIYSISLLKKDGDAFVAFKDENKEVVKYIFPEKPTALELGIKVMEMFEYKERYDGLIE